MLLRTAGHGHSSLQTALHPHDRHIPPGLPGIWYPCGREGLQHPLPRSGTDRLRYAMLSRGSVHNQQVPGCASASQQKDPAEPQRRWYPSCCDQLRLRQCRYWQGRPRGRSADGEESRRVQRCRERQLSSNEHRCHRTTVNAPLHLNCFTTYPKKPPITNQQPTHPASRSPRSSTASQQRTQPSPQHTKPGSTQPAQSAPQTPSPSSSRAPSPSPPPQTAATASQA